MGTVQKIQFNERLSGAEAIGGIVTRDMVAHEAITLTERAAILMIDRITMVVTHVETGNYKAIAPLCRGIETMARQMYLEKIETVAEQLAQASECSDAIAIAAIANRLERLAEAQLVEG